MSGIEANHIKRHFLDGSWPYVNGASLVLRIIWY